MTETLTRDQRRSAEVRRIKKKYTKDDHCAACGIIRELLDRTLDEPEENGICCSACLAEHPKLQGRVMTMRMSMDTLVINLRTGERRYYTLPAERAVVNAAHQSRGDWNWWEYDYTDYERGPSGRTVFCGDWGAVTEENA